LLNEDCSHMLQTIACTLLVIFCSALRRHRKTSKRTALGIIGEPFSTAVKRARRSVECVRPKQSRRRRRGSFGEERGCTARKMAPLRHSEPLEERTKGVESRGDAFFFAMF